MSMQKIRSDVFDAAALPFSPVWRLLPRDVLWRICAFARPRALYFENVDDACLMEIASKIRSLRDDTLWVRLVRVSPLMHMSTMVYSLLHELYPDIWRELMDMVQDFEGSFATARLVCLRRVEDRLSHVFDLLVCEFSVSTIPKMAQQYVLRYMLLSQIGLRALARLLLWVDCSNTVEDTHAWLPRVSHEWSRLCEKSPLLYNFEDGETQLYSMSLSNQGVPRCNTSLRAALSELLLSDATVSVSEKTLLGVFMLRDLRCLLRRGEQSDVDDIRFYEHKGDVRVLICYPWYTAKSLSSASSRNDRFEVAKDRQNLEDRPSDVI